MSTRYDFTIEQGATLVESFDCEGVDLTGASLRMQARENIKTADTVLDLSTDSGEIVVTDAVLGEFEIRLSAAETSALSFTTAIYDIEIIHADATVSRAFRGIINLSLEVTR